MWPRKQAGHMTCTRPQAESQKNPLTRGRRPHMTQTGASPLWLGAKIKNSAPGKTADTVRLAAERTLMLGRGYSFRHWGAESRGLDARL